MGNNRAKKIGIILGTRPEIIKMSPIIRNLLKNKFKFFIIHTNQHYAKNLDRLFFDELEIPLPKYNLKIGSGMHGEITGKMLAGIEKILIKENPAIILVQGDTNTVLAGALASIKLKIKIGHIEAGLRSNDRNMPEEINRILTDHCSDFLFPPTKEAAKNLIQEGISRKKIFITGNTVADSVFQNIRLANRKSKIIENMNTEKKSFFLATFHRPENVDNKKKLSNIMKGIKNISSFFNVPVIFPIHPRTKKMIEKFMINTNGIKIIDPLGYLDFLKLESNAIAIITDSGGIQEEACILKTPCITTRENTERPETIKLGCNILSGTKPNNILNRTKKIISKKIKWNNPFGKGDSSKKIINILLKKL